MRMITTVIAAICLMAVAAAQDQGTPSAEGIKQKAEAGDATAQGQYAQMLQFGQGVEKNETEALKWYQKSAEAGNDYSQANLGVLYQTGRCGVTKDFAKAAEWYRKAAEQGNAYAQFYLANLYESGNGVEKDMKKAIELLEQAAKGGMAQAQMVYAWRLYEGDGVKKDLKKAVTLFGKAANGGIAAAQSRYALFLVQGEGVDMNIAEALKWAEKAAAADDENAKQLVPMIKKMKDMEDKTPKSLLGVEFGDDINKWSGSGFHSVETSQDGMSVKVWTKAPRKFRKFSDGSFDVYATLETKKIYKFCWNSEAFAKGTSRQSVDSEALDTCKVIAKKFGVECEKDGRAFVVRIGYVKVSITSFLEHHLEMEVVHERYADLMKKEYEAKKAAQGDGSDVL